MYKPTKSELSGIYFDKIYSNNRVYVGGGDELGRPRKSGSKIIDCYDIEKNKWFSPLPETNIGHGNATILWMDNGYQLNIASTFANCIETIDLRERNKWNVIVDDNSFNDLFGIEIEKQSLNNHLFVSSADF